MDRSQCYHFYPRSVLPPVCEAGSIHLEALNISDDDSNKFFSKYCSSIESFLQEHSDRAVVTHYEDQGTERVCKMIFRDSNEKRDDFSVQHYVHKTIKTRESVSPEGLFSIGPSEDED